MRSWTIGLMVVALTACASMTPTVTRQEAFAIYDVRAASNAGSISDGITQALQKNIAHSGEVDRRIR